MFVGVVVDNSDERIEKKIFHCEIVVNNERVAAAVRAAMIYSLIASCKGLGVNPREWITDVLTKLPLYRDTSKDLCELLPMNWKNNSNS